MTTRISSVALGLAVLALAACGDGKKPADGGGTGGGGTAPDATKPADGGAAPAGAKPYDKAAHAGSVSGTVKFGGTPPAPRLLAIAGDAFCDGALASHPKTNEDWVVNADGTVPNAVVWADKGPHTAFAFTPPTDRNLVVTQRDCYYVPHVFAVMAGEKFTVTSEDATSHNVHTKPTRTPEFNKAQNKGDKDVISFDKKETKPVAIVCDIHSWMSAWSIVLDHPLVAVTDAAGKFSIAGLPDGTYDMKAWTKELGSASFKVTIAGGAVTQDVTISKQ